MAKCIKMYERGCGAIQIAMSESKNWFIRSYEHCPFGYKWTKWKSLGMLEKIQRDKYTWENRNGNEITTKCIYLTFPRETWEVKLSHKKDVNGRKFRLPY